MRDWYPEYIEAGKTVLYRGVPKRVESVNLVPETDPYWLEQNPNGKMVEIVLDDGTRTNSLINITNPNPKRRGGKK